jgi:hypothetical protein
MNATVYLRVARTGRGFKYSATTKPSREPLRTANNEPLATIAFGVRLVIPDNAFTVPVVTGIEIPADKLTIVGAAEGIE